MGVSANWGCTWGDGTIGCDGLIWFTGCSATAVGLFFGGNMSATVIGKAGRSSQRVYWSSLKVGPWYCWGRVMCKAFTFGSWKCKGRGLGSSVRGAPSLDSCGIGLGSSACGAPSFGSRIHRGMGLACSAHSTPSFVSWKPWGSGLGRCVHGSWWHWGATAGARGCVCRVSMWCLHLEQQLPFCSWLGMGCSWLTMSRLCLNSRRRARTSTD